MVDEIGEDDLLIHHFSLGSRASRMAFALPCRMMLVYHNITPPEYFLGVHEQLVRQCYHGRRELLPYRSRMRPGARRLGIQPAGTRGPRLLPHGGAAGRARLLAPGCAAGRPRVCDAYDDEWTNILFVGPRDSEQAPGQRDPLLPRLQDAVQPASAAAAGRARTAASRRTWRSCTHSSARLGVEDVHILGQVTNEELTALYDVADLFLCASEHEGFCVPIVEAFHKRVPVLAYAATAVPATMDGGGVLTRRADPRRGRGADARRVWTDDRSRTGFSTHRTPRSRASARRISTARCCASSTRSSAAPRLPPARWPTTSGASSAGRRARSDPPVAARRVSGLPFAPDDEGLVADLGHAR